MRTLRILLVIVLCLSLQVPGALRMSLCFCQGWSSMLDPHGSEACCFVQRGCGSHGGDETPISAEGEARALSACACGGIDTPVQAERTAPSKAWNVTLAPPRPFRFERPVSPEAWLPAAHGFALPKPPAWAGASPPLRI